jgi:hypothetical protein
MTNLLLAFRRGTTACYAFALLSISLHAQAPPAPANVRVRILPAHVAFSWDPQPEAEYYRVYRGEINRRWIPLLNVTSPVYFDTDFKDLPGYYQIAAFNSYGAAATPEFLVSNAVSATPMRLLGVNPRPVSDTALGFVWHIGGVAGTERGDALLELGTSPDVLPWVFSNPDFAQRHEVVISNLAPQTIYYFRLTSVDTNGVGVTYRNQFATRPFVAPHPVVRLNDPAPALETDEDVPLAFTLTADAAEGTPLSFRISQPPFEGTITGTPPELVYVPKPEGYGTDFFWCAYSDGTTTNFAIVYVTVRSVKDAPIALDKSVTLPEDRGIKVQVEATGWDGNPSEFDCAVVATTTNGVLSRTVGAPAGYLEFQYMPNTNFNGVDHFTYHVWHGSSTGNVATVRLRVTPMPDAPVARNQTVAMLQDTLTIITADASDPDGDTLYWTVVAGPSHGTLWPFSSSNDGTYNYRPAAGYSGPDSFTYSVSDGVNTASATVTINVLPPNHPPVADAIAASTEFQVPVAIMLTASDPDQDMLSFNVTSNPLNGTVSGAAPSLLYTPGAGFSGSDSFIFEVSDGRDRSYGTVTITVGPSNAPPNAPTGLIVTAVSRTDVTLQWTDNSGREESFSIERAGEKENWRPIVSVPANTVTFVNTKVGPNKTYRYRVRAVSPQGASEYSNVVTATTLR